MKINPVFTIIALAISALAGYGFYSWNVGEPYQLLVATGGCFTIFLPLVGLLALSSDRRGIVGNIRALSSVFLLLEIITNIIFNMVKMSRPTAYVIVNGIFVLVYILIGYAASRVLK